MRDRRPYTAIIGADAKVVRADGSSINFGDAIYHPDNAEEARQYASSEPASTGLDVERLADAIHAAHPHGRQLTMTDAEYDHWLAAAIAREYARLSVSSPQDDPS
jgi:hypothetical protein